MGFLWRVGPLDFPFAVERQMNGAMHYPVANKRGAKS